MFVENIIYIIKPVCIMELIKRVLKIQYLLTIWFYLNTSIIFIYLRLTTIYVVHYCIAPINPINAKLRTFAF